MLPTPRPTHRLQVVGSSCGQSLGAGGHRFKSDRPDQFPARGPSLRSGFRQRAPASLTPAKRLKFKSDRPDQSLRSISRRGKKRLPRLPAPRIAPAMEAGYHHNPMLLHLEEYAIREAPPSRPPTTSVDHGELQGVVCDCLNRGLDRQRENAPQAPGECCHTKTALLQILIRLWDPDDRRCHGFLNRPALTCCHGTTSEGFCSCRAMR